MPGAGEGAGFVADAFHHATVAQEGVGVVVDDGQVLAVELGGQQLLGQREAHGIGDALTQRAGGGLDAGGDVDFGVAGGLAVQLAEVLDLGQGQVVAREVQHRVDQHRGVAVGQHEAVAVEPVRVGGVVAQVLAPQGDGHVGHAHRCARMSGIGLLNGIHCQRADRVGHQGLVCHGQWAFGGKGWVGDTGEPEILPGEPRPASIQGQHPTDALLCRRPGC
ncbi:hypothetical protein FQZ97_882930 [compost metagenome]